MKQSIWKGIVHGKTVILEKGARIPEGTEVLVSTLVPGTLAALLALKAGPHLDPKDVDALERTIEEGKKLVDFRSPFHKRRVKNRK